MSYFLPCYIIQHPQNEVNSVNTSKTLSSFEMIVGGEFSVAFLVMPEKHNSNSDGKNWCCHPEFTLKGTGIV